MFHNKAAIRQVLWVLLGETVCTVLMVGVFALLNRFSVRVLLGAGIGLTLSVLNFLFLSIGVSRAADKAENGQSEQAAAGRVWLFRVAQLCVCWFWQAFILLFFRRMYVIRWR